MNNKQDARLAKIRELDAHISAIEQILQREMTGGAWDSSEAAKLALEGAKATRQALIVSITDET